MSTLIGGFPASAASADACGVCTGQELESDNDKGITEERRACCAPRQAFKSSKSAGSLSMQAMLVILGKVEQLAN